MHKSAVPTLQIHIKFIKDETLNLATRQTVLSYCIFQETELCGVYVPSFCQVDLC